MPVVPRLGPVGERPAVELECDDAGLARVECDLLESFELVGGPGGITGAWRNIQLHDFRGAHLTGVRDDGAHLHGIVMRDCTEVANLEGGVGHAVSERVCHLPAEGVVVSVAHEHAFAVIHMPCLPGPVGHARIVEHAHRDGLREFARGAHIAEDDIGERIAALPPEQPPLQQAPDRISPRCD